MLNAGRPTRKPSTCWSFGGRSSLTFEHLCIVVESFLSFEFKDMESFLSFELEYICTVLHPALSPLSLILWNNWPAFSLKYSLAVATNTMASARQQQRKLKKPNTSEMKVSLSMCLVLSVEKLSRKICKLLFKITGPQKIILVLLIFIRWG